MTIKTGCVGFHISFSVPNNATERADDFFETHENIYERNSLYRWRKRAQSYYAMRY